MGAPKRYIVLWIDSGKGPRAAVSCLVSEGLDNDPGAPQCSNLVSTPRKTRRDTKKCLDNDKSIMTEKSFGIDKHQVLPRIPWNFQIQAKTIPR
jgi:hypothetical protein